MQTWKILSVHSPAVKFQSLHLFMLPNLHNSNLTVTCFMCKIVLTPDNWVLAATPHPFPD